MNKANGKAYRVYEGVGKDQQTTPPEQDQTPPVASPAAPQVPQGGKSLQGLGLAMIPFTPVGFTGKGAGMAYARLAIYAGLSYVTWARSRQLSYIFGGAAAVSLATSLAGGAWQNRTAGNA